MVFTALQQKAAHFVTNNSSSLLTAGGVIGVGVTAALTGRASFKAAEIIRQRQHLEEVKRGERIGIEIPLELSTREKVAIAWPQFIPPAIAGVATIGCIVMANRMSAKRAAALAAAYGISEQRLTEYKNKVQERFGANKATGVRDDIAQDRVNNNPPSKEVVIIGNGDVLCYDSLSGRYFHSSVEAIKKAETNLNSELFHHQYASLSSFYDDIGLPPTTFSEELGWNTMSLEPLEIKFSTTITPDNRPCLVLDYSTMPSPDYHRLY